MRFTSNNTRTGKTGSAPKPHKVHTVKRLIKLTRPHLFKVIFAGVGALIINMTQLAKPYILKLVIDDFLVGRAVQKGFYSISAMAFLYLTIASLGGFFSFAQINLVNRAGQDIIRNLSNKVFRTIQFLPLTYLDKTSSGRLITRATNDVEALSELYTDVIINLFKDVFLLTGIIYTMLALNLKLALISFSVLPVMFYIVYVFKKKIRANFLNMKHLIGRINGFMAENISGMKIIQMFRAEEEKKREFLKLNDDYFKTTSLQVRLNSYMKPGVDVFQNLAIAVLIWYGAGGVGDKTLQLGVLYAFTTYIRQFFAPISDLADKYTTIQSALVSADRIFELLDQESSLENLDQGISMENIKGNVEFRNVWFSYNDRDWILKDVSFKLRQGETAAFVGETGAGKTTIISLINGFYRVQKGEILIDGININDIKLRDLRTQISVILQDVFLFSGDIKKNVSLDTDISQEKIEEALRISHASSFVSNLAKGIHEPVMEGGKTLSAGHKQLLSFARAIAHNPSIFVLDEATANIDTLTEKLIQEAIENVTKDKTTLIIAHRLSTIRNADKIIVLKNGEIVETGTHRELINKGGYYRIMLDEDKCSYTQTDCNMVNELGLALNKMTKFT